MTLARILIASLFITLASAAATGDDLPPRFEIRGADVATYDISGSTVEELREEMNRKGPHGWHGYTEWDLTWKCRDITVACTVTLPSWEPDEAEPELRRKFRTYWNNLARHEQGHIDIVTRLVGKGKQRVRAMECFAATMAWADTLRAIKRESDEYDRKTEHGKTQGALF